MAGILASYCFFLTVESAGALKHLGEVLKGPRDYRKKVDPETLRNTSASSILYPVTIIFRRGWRLIRSLLDIFLGCGTYLKRHQVIFQSMLNQEGWIVSCNIGSRMGLLFQLQLISWSFPMSLDSGESGVECFRGFFTPLDVRCSLFS